MTLAAWLHDLSPFVWRINGDFGIRWYGVAYLAGFVVGYLILVKLARRGLIRIPAERVADAIMWLVFGVLVGGRLGYVIVYDPSAWITFTKSFPFWGVLAIHHGGMASHGGIVGVIVAAYRISRGFKDPATGQIVGRCPPLHIMDAAALICPAGLFFGRLANFVNGELLGRIVAPPGTPGPWWTVQYPQELRGVESVDASGLVTVGEHAPQLTAEQGRALFDLLGRVGSPQDRLSSKINYVIEHAREFAPQLRGLLSSRHPSQLYQAAAEGLVLAAVLWVVWRVPRRPGVVGGWFLITYGVLRVVTEIWRLPDAQFAEGRPYGLSRGQWLSVGMVIAGVGLLWIARKWYTERFGGWGVKRAGGGGGAGGPEAGEA